MALIKLDGRGVAQRCMPTHQTTMGLLLKEATSRTNRDVRKQTYVLYQMWESFVIGFIDAAHHIVCDKPQFSKPHMRIFPAK